MNDGHQILLVGDFNSAITDLTDWCHSLGLVDIIANQHGPGPITYKRSHSTPIDAIFGSPNLSSTRSGYLSFKRLLSDHRGLWIDIPQHLLFGYNPPPIHHPNARRLNLKDPRVVTAYLEFLKAACHEHAIFHRMKFIHDNFTCPLSDILRKEFEEVDLFCVLSWMRLKSNAEGYIAVLTLGILHTNGLNY